MTAEAVGGTWCIIVAAGSGQRFGGDKLGSILEPPQGTVLERSIQLALAATDGVVVVVGADSALLATEDSAELRFVAGGNTRSASVRAGLDTVPMSASVVLVHDGARPLATIELFGRVIDAVRAGAAAVVPAVPVVDTMREVGGGVVDRERLRAVQTPQGFDAAALRAAHREGGDASDDAAMVEAMGHEVVLVDGEVSNLKITRPVDLVVARALVGMALALLRSGEEGDR